MAQLTDIGAPAAHENGRSSETPRKTLKILVIGATRGTGQQVMRQALAAGDTVTALARDPARIDTAHERLHVLRGDVLDPSSLGQAMSGCDAVISSLGVTSARAATTLYSEGMRNIIQAMRAAKVKRLIAVSAGPLSRDDGDTLPTRLLFKPLLWAIFKQPYTDLARMEQEIRESGLDWTIVRPPRLTSKPPTGHYRTAINGSVRGGFSIARADLAAAILMLLDDPAAIHAAIGISY